MNPILYDLTEVIDHFSEISEPAIAVKDARGVLFLIAVAEADIFYVGVPYEEDESGNGINPHTAFLSDMKNASRPIYPLFVLGAGSAS